MRTQFYQKFPKSKAKFVPSNPLQKQLQNLRFDVVTGVRNRIDFVDAILVLTDGNVRILDTELDKLDSIFGQPPSRSTRRFNHQIKELFGSGAK